MAAASEAIITILTDGAAIDAVYHGPSGLLSGDVTGKLFIEMSTVPPGVETTLAPKVRAKGATFVECPVGGSTAPARQGKLLGLMGAEPADAARATPILDQLCRKVEHCGAVGAGASMKLAINLPLMIGWQALRRGLRARAATLGWEPKRLIDLFAESNGANNGFKLRADMIVAMMENRDPGPTTFSIANAVKDLQDHDRHRRRQGRRHAGGESGAGRARGIQRQGSWRRRDASRQTVYWPGRGKQ